MSDDCFAPARLPIVDDYPNVLQIAALGLPLEQLTRRMADPDDRSEMDRLRALLSGATRNRQARPATWA
jgi:hypothetical protein